MKIPGTKKHTQSGSATGDLMLFTAIVIVLGVLWVSSGGLNKETSQRNALGINSFLSPTIQGAADSGSEASQTYDEITEEFGRTRDFGETSPYWGMVTIKKSSSGLKQSAPQNEYIVIAASSKLDEGLTLTGWKLQSMISKEIVTIPKATKVSTSGNVNIEQPIVIFPKDEVYLLTGHSPVGNSFQINKCSGYFEQFQDFTPSISKQCPRPKDEFVFSENDPFRFGAECLRYIENLSQCYMPLEALPIGFSDSCTLFITEEINYSSCIKNHRNDADFFKPQWRVYLKHDQEIWGTRDIIRLLDENGKTVDVFSY